MWYMCIYCTAQIRVNCCQCVRRTWCVLLCSTWTRRCQLRRTLKCSQVKLYRLISKQSVLWQNYYKNGGEVIVLKRFWRWCGIMCSIYLFCCLNIFANHGVSEVGSASVIRWHERMEAYSVKSPCWDRLRLGLWISYRLCSVWEVTW
jgi:hypothetical protein